MRLSVLILLGGCLCMVLASTRDAPEEELTTATVRRTFQRRKHVDLKATNGTRRRRKKHRRPQHHVPLTFVEGDNSTADVSREAEYNQRVRSFASAIKDTDTFLRFLKLEESRHMRDFVRGRDFNYNNRSLTTRFLQNPMLRINDRAKRPPETSSVGHEGRRSSADTHRSTDRHFEPTQQFYQDVGARFEKEVARTSKNPIPRDKKRSRTARRRFEKVPKFSGDELRYEDEKNRLTTKQFVPTTQTNQDIESGSTTKETISETNTERVEVVPITDEDRKPTTQTFSSTSHSKQDLEPTLSYKTSTAKVEAILNVNEQPPEEESRRPTTLTTLPQPTRQLDPMPSKEVIDLQISPEVTEIPNLRTEEQQSTIGSRRPTSVTFASTTTQPKEALEPRRVNEGRRSRTRTTGSRHREQDHNVETKRNQLKHVEESTYQLNHDARVRSDNEVTRSLPNHPPRDKLRSRSSSERFENVPITNYETRTTGRQYVATPKSHQDPESRFENELSPSRSSNSFESVRNTNREEPIPTFTTRRTTTRRYEETTLPIEYPESRSVKETKQSRNSHEKFENVPKPNVRQQLNYEPLIPTNEQSERTTQSNYYVDTRPDIEVSRPRSRDSAERFENVLISNRNVQQTTFETRRPTTSQYETATQSNGPNSRFENEVRRSKIPEKLDNDNIFNHREQQSAFETRRPTASQFETTTKFNYGPRSRFENDVQRSKIPDKFVNVLSSNRNEQQSAFETRRPTASQFETTTQSNYGPRSRFDNDVHRSKTPENFENVLSSNRHEQQSTFETRRPTASQFETTTPSYYEPRPRYENEVQRSKIPERFENVPYRNERLPLDETTTSRHFVSTSQSNQNVGSRYNDETNTVTRDNKRSKVSPDRFEIAPIRPDDPNTSFEIRRAIAGLFNSKPPQDFESSFYNEVTQPSIRFVPPEYSEKLVPTPRFNDESTHHSRYDNRHRTSTHKTYRYLNDDYDEIKVPNRGLLPPIEPIEIDEDYYQTTTPQQSVRFSDNDTIVTGRRAPSSSKKHSRKSKSRNPDRYLKHPDDDYDELRLTAAESTYYKKRKLTRLPMIDTYDSQQVIPGVAGRDYTVFSAPPDSEFSCGKGHMGYFADVGAGCQVFYICTGDGRGEPMLCPNGTLFNQNVLVCDWWFNVVCSYK